MTAEAFAISLRAFCRRKRFHPFIIEFHTGERLTISHPEAIVIESGDVVRTSRGRHHRLFDASSVNQLMDVPDA